ncbi:MAG: DNA primase [Firmicutes bacterium]|nr:DNA primase [Bacillota bacterium]
MSKYSQNEILAEIYTRTDIVDLISEYVVLRKKGKDYWGRCPFHLEDTPSFTVSPDKQLFYCFGCQTGGNAINFIQKKDGLTFWEAAAVLAERVGVELNSKENSPTRQREYSEKQKFWRMQAAAAAFYHELLLVSPEGQVARDYLTRRGINEESIKRFQLGFSLPAWDALLRHLLNQGFSAQELAQAGLIVARGGGGGYYDRFRGRLMFPIYNYMGKIVGFGGRILESGEPKYLNSAESRFFSKGDHLYGLHMARTSIQHSQQAILVEGYLDVITAHQFGITNVVGSLGTALTETQARLLVRYSPEVILAYDTDQAGVAATMRGIEILRSQGARVKVLTLPDGKDPDEFIQKHGREAFQNALRKWTQGFFAYKLRRACERYDWGNVTGKVAVVEELLPDLAQVNSEIEQQEYIRLLARTVDISEEAIVADFRKYLGKTRKTGTNWDRNAQFRHNKIEVRALTNPLLGKSKLAERINRPAHLMAERKLLQMILEDCSVWPKAEAELGPDLFTDEYLQKIWAHLRNYLANRVYNREGLARVIDELDDPACQSLLTEICFHDCPADVEQRERLLDDYIKTIKRYRGQQRIEQLRQQIITLSEAGLAETTEAKNLMSEYQALLREHKVK